MNIEDFRNYCLSFKETTEGLPFDENTLVFSVCGKMFAVTGIEPFDFVNLKCDPDYALELRGTYDEITPGWHMNKKHWNSVRVDGDLDDDFIKELITHSYEMVVKGLPKKVQNTLL